MNDPNFPTATDLDQREARFIQHVLGDDYDCYVAGWYYNVRHGDTIGTSPHSFYEAVIYLLAREAGAA